jgi:hypothetical protein
MAMSGPLETIRAAKLNGPDLSLPISKHKPCGQACEHCGAVFDGDPSEWLDALANWFRSQRNLHAALAAERARKDLTDLLNSYDDEIDELRDELSGLQP